MLKIKNKLFTIPALIFSAFIFIFTSCGDLHLEDMSKGSVVFNFNSDFFSKIDKKQVSHSRAAFEEYFSYGHYIDVSLEGDFNYSATINLSSQTYISIDAIPVGARITATLTLYKWPDINDENSKTTLFTGQSEKTTIKAGSNVIKINIAENQYRIYVKLDASKNDSNFLTRDACSEDLSTHNGTKSSPFEYIQSAIYYLADNGESDKDYEIYLTGYTEDQAFNQTTTFAEWSGSSETDILQNKVKSIYLTSETPEIPAIVSTHRYTFSIVTTVPIHFKNIKVKSTYSESADPNNNGNIIIADTASANIFLDYNSVLEWENTSGEDSYTPAQLGGAICLGNSQISSNLTMSSNSKIKGFKSHYYGGAIYIYKGSVTMTDNSQIIDCSVKSGEGGAIYIESGNVTLNKNASIESCSSSTYGGAVYLKNSGASLKMEGNSSINNCSSTYSGGAIYIKAGSFDMSGGIITGNTAGSTGNGIYVIVGSSQISLKDKAHLSLNDDIFVSANEADSTNPFITISGELEYSPAACLSLIHSSTSESTHILTKNNYLNSNYNKIVVNPTSASGSTTETYWYINSYGYISKFENITEAVDKPNVGDIILSDGRRVLSEYADMVPYSLKKRVAGVIFYAGNETDLLGNTNLMVGKEWYHDYFDKNTSPTNFDTTTKISGIEVINDTYQINIKATSTFSSSELTNPQTGESYLSDNQSLIFTLLNTSQPNNSTYPLLAEVLSYGKSFDETSEYYCNTDDATKNWYIPTIAEYFMLYQAFNNSDFKTSYNAVCSDISNSTFVSTTRYGTGVWSDYSVRHAYVYTCNFTTDTLGIDIAFNQNYALPIHTY